MPRPIPNTVPSEIVSLMAAKNWNDFTDMSRHAGIPWSTLSGIFLHGRQHDTLQRWCDLADALEYKPDSLVEIYEAEDYARLTAKFKKLYQGNVRDFCTAANTHPNGARRFLDGAFRFSTVQNYHKIANALGVSLDALADILLRRTRN